MLRKASLKSCSGKTNIRIIFLETQSLKWHINIYMTFVLSRSSVLLEIILLDFLDLLWKIISFTFLIYVHLSYNYYCCIAMVNYTYTYACRNIFNTIKTSGQFFIKIYLSLYWNGCMWEGVEDRTKTASYWPPSSSGQFSWAAQKGAWGPASLLWAGSHSSNWNTDFKLWTPTDSVEVLRATSAGCWFSLQHLISHWLELPVRRVILLFYAHSVQSVDTQGITWHLRPDASVIYRGAYLILTAWPGRRSICNTTKYFL